MTAMPTAAPITAAEFLELPESPRARRTELIHGELVVNEPIALHGHVQTNLTVALANWARAEPGRGSPVSPRDVDIDELNVFAPDLLWYADGRLPDPESPPPYELPDLAVEVRSPSTWRYVLGPKKSAYERRGLPELWLVDTVSRTVLVFRRSRPRAPAFDVALELTAPEELSSPLLPGFSLPVGEVFRVQ